LIVGGIYLRILPITKYIEYLNICNKNDVKIVYCIQKQIFSKVCNKTTIKIIVLVQRGINNK